MRIAPKIAIPNLRFSFQRLKDGHNLILAILPVAVCIVEQLLRSYCGGRTPSDLNQDRWKRSGLRKPTMSASQQSDRKGKSACCA
jgi:hypothetical protein